MTVFNFFLFLDSIEAQLCASAADASAEERSVPRLPQFNVSDDGPADLANHREAPQHPPSRRGGYRQHTTGLGGTRDLGATNRARDREGFYSSASAWSEWSVSSTTSPASSSAAATPGGPPPAPTPPGGWVAGVNIPVRFLLKTVLYLIVVYISVPILTHFKSSCFKFSFISFYFCSVPKCGSSFCTYFLHFHIFMFYVFLQTHVSHFIHYFNHFLLFLIISIFLSIFLFVFISAPLSQLEVSPSRGARPETPQRPDYPPGGVPL